jgi:hypothetical protein
MIYRVILYVGTALWKCGGWRVLEKCGTSTLNVGENGQRPAGEEYHARFTT